MNLLACFGFPFLYLLKNYSPHFRNKKEAGISASNTCFYI
uniref:Uncharacterized protein n=1 Tax=virus sp. ctiha2 TaxID=2827299 RepID=A0A8S5RGW9_9VIRU|nr:MAG TPA: hypothetical protein [virus sp. ctiha2]